MGRRGTVAMLGVMTSVMMMMMRCGVGFIRVTDHRMENLMRRWNDGVAGLAPLRVVHLTTRCTVMSGDRSN